MFLYIFTVAPILFLESISPIFLVVFVFALGYLLFRVRKTEWLKPLIIVSLLSFVAAYVLMGGWFRSTEGMNAFLQLLVFILLCVALVLYYVFVILRDDNLRSSKIGTILFLPFGYFMLIVSATAIMWFSSSDNRTIRIDVGRNPYIIAEYYQPKVRVHFWEAAFWTGKFSEKKEAQLVQEHKHVRLIKHIGDEKAIGWEEFEVIEAFNEPDSRIETEIGETWIYNAWKNHPDWELPVYMKDGKLMQIGDKKN